MCIGIATAWPRPARHTTGCTDYGLYLMAAAMFLGTILVQLLPRGATIDEAEHGVVLAESAAVGV